MRPGFAFIPLLFAAAVASAGPPADSITVTAHRTPQALDRSGSAVSIVDSRQIAERQAIVAADALRAVPGVALARSGPFGAQTQLRMRGAEANQVLVLIDGVEANDPATADEFSFEHLSTFDIERIEVVRGPQSALWGSDALAGVVSVVTRTPTAPLEAGGYTEGGSFGLRNGGARLGLRTDTAALSLSASGLETDGTNASRSGNEDDGYRNTTVNLRGSLALSPGLSFGLGARHVDSSTEFDGVDAFTTGLPVDSDNETDAEQTYLRGGLRLALFQERWTQDLAYTVTSTDTRTVAENLLTPALDYDASTVAADKYGLHYETSLRITRGDDRTPGHLLTLAADHERQEFRQRGAVQDFFGTLYDPNQDQRTYATGVAAEYLAYLGPSLSVSASVRHDDNSEFDDANTWRTTASWNLPDDATRLHGSFGTGQKAPTFVERFGFYPSQFVGNPDLEPERSKGWDLGLARRWLDGRLVTDLTYFRAELDDAINGFYCASFPCTAINSAGESRRRGVEFTADATLGDHYGANFSYTYTDSRGDDPGTAELELVGEVRRPRHTGSLNLTGRWLGDRLSVNLGAAYTGDREDDFFPPPFFFPAERVELDAYTLVTLAASFRVSAHVEVYGRIENALDEDYEDVYGFATPGAGGYAGVRVKLAR